MKSCPYACYATALAVTLWVGTTAAQEVSLESFTQKLPSFSTDDPELDSYYFSAEVPTPFKFQARYELAWSKSDGHCFLLTDGNRVPIFMIAQKQLFLYDASTGTVWLFGDLRPNIIAQITSSKFTFTYGFGEKNKTDVKIDFLSWLCDDNLDRRLLFVDKEIWTVTAPSQIKKFVNVDYKATFDLSSEWPLKSVVMQGRNDPAPMIAVRDIAINQPIPARLRIFPANERFPQQVKLKPITDAQIQSFGDGFDVVKMLMRCFVAPTAIAGGEPREMPIWKGVDWDEAARLHQEIGPALIELLQIPGVDLADAKSLSPIETR